MIRDLEAQLERAWMIGSAGAVIAVCCGTYLVGWWIS